MEVGTIRRINIDSEMQASYLDYAMSVIVSRALPDVRDGLKPVHRRILYAMYDLGLTSDKPYKKSARIVGEVLGKYHPHGDAAVYEAMVRMAQDFSLRYPLVDGQGNFGSIDGDNAAAMRYTEARLAPIANEMLADIEKDTVDWSDNFDGTLREPTVLPAALPNLVVNGAAGIAVGMATNIPPHNLGEVCDALCFLIDNYDRAEDISTDDLMRFIQGPDFPTGGIVFRYEHEGSGADAEQVDAIERAYGSGRGSLVVQARAHIEEMSRSRSRIVVTELPYQTDKSRLLERIAELVRDGRIEGITDLRDESDRTGMRICIELTRTVDSRRVLADLYKYTPLQSTFGVSLLALVDGEPRLLSLKRLLLHFLEHRQVVIVRRTHHDLVQARQRAHILEGLLRALDVLDEIIALIRGSRNAEAARQELKRRFEFSEAQAQAILDMQLRRLAALERQRLGDEYKQTLKLIKELEALLASPKKVLALIKENLTGLKTRYADPRRTQIADRAKAVLTAREHAVERDVWIAVDAAGKLATYPRGAEGAPVRGSRALPHIFGPSGKAPRHLLPGNTRQDLYLFSASGRAARVQGHQWPEAPASLTELAGLKDPVVALLALSPDEGEEKLPGFVLLGTVQGKVKRVNLADLRQATAQPEATPQVVGLDEGDSVVWAANSQGEGEVFLFTADGQAIRFAEQDVRPMGLPAGGIGGIRLREGDRVVSGFVLGQPGSSTNTGGNGDDGTVPLVVQPRPLPTGIAIVTLNGFIKQVEVPDFPAQGRNGVGVMAASLSTKSGSVVGAALLGRNDLLVCIGTQGGNQYLLGCDIPVSARATQGRPIVLKDEQVSRIYPVVLPAAGPPGPRGTGDDDGSERSPRRRTRATPAGTTPKSAPARKPANGSAAPDKSARSKPAPRGETSGPVPGASNSTGAGAPTRPKRSKPAKAGAPSAASGPDAPTGSAAAGTAAPSSRSKAAALQPVPDVPQPPAGVAGPAPRRTVAPPTAAPAHAKSPGRKSAAKAVSPAASTQLPELPQPPAGVTRRATGQAAPEKAAARRKASSGAAAQQQPAAAQAKGQGSEPARRAAAQGGAAAQKPASRAERAAKPAVVEQTPTRVTFDRETLEKSVDLKRGPAKPSTKAPGQQLALVPEELAPGERTTPKKPAASAPKATGAPGTGKVEPAPATSAKKSSTSKPKAIGAPPLGREAASVAGTAKKSSTSTSKATAARPTGQGTPAAPAAAKKPARGASDASSVASPAAAKTPAKSADPGTTGKASAAKPAKREAPAASPRAKRPAADGPMTWPLIPASDEDDGVDDIRPAPPTRRRPRA